MAVSRVLRATGCASCRLSLLRALTGSSIRFQPFPTLLPHSSPSLRVNYSSQFTQETGKQLENDEIETQESERLDEEVIFASQETIEVSKIPWYLQVQTPERTPQPLSERQQIPDLPDSPPLILEPLLQQISIDLGLDSLSLLDLRKLDPPPALGANLLMILGTARSEKHLHVSADRLCRWLRSTYKLRPDADGLLGRSELKLKLRRKSRRAKMMGSAGDETGDDGVRTGWVCVDVGVVDAPEAPEGVKNDATQDFVGFGRKTDGVRIVVQMLTEEKRLEIDLEKLWGGILRRGITEIEEPEDEASQMGLLLETIEQSPNRSFSSFSQS